MQIFILSTLLLGCWAHDPNFDAQYINYKSVKGGGGGGQFQYRGGDNLVRFYNNTQSGYGRTNLTASAQRVGICYKEVPTASLARDPKHVPAGNGSRADLSRIEICCAGYIRNIHNFHLCDPVCTSECVNALCTAPNVCTCFPDHVKNLAGFCVATCPIGCQNGHCAGGECLCKEGFELNRDGKFCVPRCRGNCGGVGNCTAPNTCACQPGYHSTSEGSCRAGPGQPSQPSHQTCGSCIGGDCVGNECRCRPGYLLYKGDCQPLCIPSCTGNTRCVAPNVCSQSGPNSNQAPSYINHNPNQRPQYPNQYPQNQNNTQHPNQYPGSYPQNQNNTIHVQHTNQYPGQYPYNQNNTNQPGQYPQNTISVNYPHPIGQGTYSYNQYSEQQNHTSHGEFHNTQYTNGSYPPQQNPIYAQYPSGPPNSYPHQQYSNQPNNTNVPQQGPQQPGQYPQQPGQYPQQPGQYPEQPGLYPNQPGYYPHQTGHYPQQPGHYPQQAGHYPQQPGHYPQQPGQYPQQTGQYPQQTGQYPQYSSQNPQSQHLYPDLPQIQYANQASNRTDGQVFQQNLYNPLENITFNLQQGHVQRQAQNVSQGSNGQSYDEGQLHVWSDQFTQCADICNNGHCDGTGKCVCFNGYIPDQSNPTNCLPYCPGGCFNGVCSAPNTCVCMMGYHKDFSVKGRSACVKRNRRSVDMKPVNVAELLVFEIPDY